MEVTGETVPPSDKKNEYEAARTYNASNGGLLVSIPISGMLAIGRS